MNPEQESRFSYDRLKTIADWCATVIGSIVVGVAFVLFAIWLANVVN